MALKCAADAMPFEQCPLLSAKQKECSGGAEAYEQTCVGRPLVQILVVATTIQRKTWKGEAGTVSSGTLTKPW